jgi:putative hemolysin
VTLAGFFSAAYGASTISPDVAPTLESLGLGPGTAATVSFVGMTLIIAYLSLVLGELVPKRLAMQRAAGFTRMVATPLHALSVVMRPVVWLLSASTNLVMRLLGGDPSVKSGRVSTEELSDMVADNEDLEEDSRAILSDVFTAGDRRLREVMRPRTDVRFLEGRMTLEQARSLVAYLPHSRYPVIGDTRDDVLGFIHLRDLLPQRKGTEPEAARTGGPATVADVVRPILFLPGTNTVLPSLSRMRREGQHIAVVVDEIRRHRRHRHAGGPRGGPRGRDL